jgi:hypothetical protein
MARIQQRLDRIGNATVAAAEPAGRVASVAGAGAGRRQTALVAVAFAVSLLVVVVGYLAVALPGSWFPAQVPRSVGAALLEISRGTATRTPDALVVSAPGAGNVTIIAVNTDLRADQFQALWWIAADVPADAGARCRSPSREAACGRCRSPARPAGSAPSRALASWSRAPCRNRCGCAA